MNLKQKRPDDVELNLTPLIDVVFLLLIFFMVTTSFNKLAAIKIDLPEADGEAADTPAKLIEISIDATGNYFINQQPLVNSQIDTLRRAIENESKGQVDMPFVISADGKTPHQAVVSVMHVASQLGFFNMTFATKRPVGSN